MRPNEQNACDAFITILRSITGREHEAYKWPEEVNRNTPDVEVLLVSLGDEGDKIAVEHTAVQSFEGQIGYVKRWREIVSSVNSGCRGRIPPDRYYFLSAPPKIENCLVGKSKELFVSRLSAWVAKTAPTLLLVDGYMRTEFEGHKITLICSGDTLQLNGNVWGMPEQPEDQKALQSERLGRAVRDKLPKLMKYKENGFKTALLLEDVAGTLRGSTLSGYENGFEKVDYVVVFVSNEDRMIIGNVWKEGPVWYSSVPISRRFSFYEAPRMTRSPS
jgi:hypothetical protein